LQSPIWLDYSRFVMCDWNSVRLNRDLVVKFVRNFELILGGFALVGLLTCQDANVAAAEASRISVFNNELKPVIAKYCLRCHGSELQEGDLRIDQLNPDLISGKDAGFWHEVLNQLNEGEMPPEGEPQLTKKELSAVTTWLEAELKKAADRRNSTGGRQLMRRMSRYEYQYTLDDLLGISLDYSDQIPGDLSGEDGLMTNASLLGMSPVLMQGYLTVAEAALEEAIPDGPEKVFKESSTAISVTNVRGQRRPKRKKGDKSKKQPKPRFIAPTPGLTKTSFVHDLPRKVTFDERPFAGRFRIKVEVVAKASSDGRLPELMIQVGHRASGDYDPKKIMGRKLLPADDQPHIVEFTGNIEDFPLGKKDGYYNGSGSHNVTHLSVWLWNTAARQASVTLETPIEDVDEPLLEVLSVEFEGPLLEGYPSQTAKNLLPKSPNSDDEEVYACEVLARFLKRAYRRDVSESELAHAVDSFRTFRSLTSDFKAAMRKTMAMTLVSPKFIYLIEPAGPTGKARELNPYELATRLSYFLWASMPDDELLGLAESGELLIRDVLVAQVQRMRQDPKFERFVKHFSGQWLGLSAIDHVAVSPSAHPDFSDEIRENLKLETLAFASHIFMEDFSCRNFISSDFAILNQVVARHYGIEGVHGSHFRPVAINRNDHRGGVLTHGSISIIGSDGADSNPIYRGVWLRKRLFADPPPPPPPGAPPLDKSNPELSKLTLKEQIALHREAPSCARCHDKIDPWGVAFENYDATGRWRTASRADKKTLAVVFDATSTLPDGTIVKGMNELQDYLVENRSKELALALSRRMASYALGRQLEFSDTEMVNELVQRFEEADYRVSSLIEGIALSKAFLTK
jgi:mono/diheme cytochrome c family protein